MHLTTNKTKLDEFSMVFLNNLLSLPLILGLMLFYGELPSVVHDPALKVRLSFPALSGCFISNLNSDVLFVRLLAFQPISSPQALLL